jgi:Predicted signal transduction protein with a C-terminal ATPase domain
MKRLRFPRRKIPIRELIFLILMVFCVPFAAFFLWYNVNAINVVNDRIAANTKSKILYYQESSESVLKYVEGTMINMVANDANFRQLEFKLSELDVHLNAYEILRKYQNTMTLIPALRAMYLCSSKNNLFWKNYTYNFPYRTKGMIDEYIREKLSSRNVGSLGWTVEKIGDTYYLMRIIGISGTYCVSLVDFNLLYMTERVQSVPQEQLFYADENMQPLTGLDVLARADIRPAAIPQKAYAVVRGDRRYFLVSSYSPYLHMYLVSCSPYSGLLKSMDTFQLILLIVSVCFAALMGVCFILLYRLLISPLDLFVTAMTDIKEGQLGTRLRMPDSILEFSQIGTVFNSMMDEITKLKIEKYEQQMELQKVELQRLQIQIRPHFYLNCLKIFYGMAEQKEYRKIQEMILSLSDYLRALFKKHDGTVTVADELSSVEKFIDLQRKSGDTPPVLSTAVDPEVRGFLIPSMSLLTFVENSFKYARVPGEPLRIRIAAHMLETDGETCVNITVSDNGPGFSEESLEKLNGKLPATDSDRIGIMNIRRRLAIVYGTTFELLFFNRQGACIELFMPAK